MGRATYQLGITFFFGNVQSGIAFLVCTQRKIFKHLCDNNKMT